MLRSIALLLVTALSGLCTEARALEVRWAMVDGPPYHVDGPHGPARSVEELGEGQLDQVIRGLAAQAPELGHRFLPMSRARMWRAMQAGEPLCYVNAFRTPERLRWAHFTPVLAPISMVLVTRRGQLGAAQEVTLASVLARRDLHGVFEPDRSYGNLIDALIRQAGPQVSVAPLPDTPQLLRMLETGRMDYLVEYPPALQFLAEQLRPRPELEMHALAEERDPQATYIACTRGAWGLEVIQALDRAIRRWSTTPQAREAVLHWLPPTVAQREAPRVDNFLRDRAAASQVE
jgi:uncharacterized protein (TIGR02285 family)